MIKKLWKNTAVRYCFIGGLSYVIELIALFSLFKVFGLPRTVATGISFWIGLVIAFLLQKKFAFKDYSTETKVIAKQGVFYGLLIVFNYLFTLAVVSVFSNDLLFFSRTLALAITTIWNYFIYKQQIFSN